MITSTHATFQARRPNLWDVGTRAHVPFRSIAVKASFQRLGVGGGGASAGPECVRRVVGAYGDRQ
eukprot:3499541-Prymnesium_polylepis.1